MTSVFLCGPLCDDALRQVVLGCDASVQEATLTDHALVGTARGDDGIVSPEPEAQINGLWCANLTQGAQERLTYYMAATGQLGRVGQVIVNDRTHQAQIFTTTWDQANTPIWLLRDWQDRWGPLERMAAQEIMSAMGRIAPEDMPARRGMIRSRAASRLAAGAGVPTDLRSDQSAQSVDLQNCENAHAGFFVTRRMDLRHPRFDGSTSALVTREVFVATDAAIVLPYDPKRDRVLLVEQFRMGPFGRGDPHPWMLEPIAGRVDGGEDPADTARRECQEEAGLALRDLLHISSHYCSPGCSSEYFHCYLGLCDLPDLAQGAGGLDSEHEDIRTHVISFDAAMALLDTGEADNGPLVLSLLWLARQRDRLRASA